MLGLDLLGRRTWQVDVELLEVDPVHGRDGKAMEDLAEK